MQHYAMNDFIFMAKNPVKLVRVLNDVINEGVTPEDGVKRL